MQKASADSFHDVGTAISTLATILGLLIDDMINNSKEYPILIGLFESWMRIYRSDGLRQEESLIQFLLDQIQMYVSVSIEYVDRVDATNSIKTLVHPLYQFNELQQSTQEIRTTPDETSKIQLKVSNFRKIFSDIQKAVTQACDIHKLFPARISSTESPGSSVNLESSLGLLQTTLMNIPPYAPGENQLIWVCATAVLRSSRGDQIAFFTRRLAELLHRAGYSDIPEKLAFARSHSISASLFGFESI